MDGGEDFVDSEVNDLENVDGEMKADASSRIARRKVRRRASEGVLVESA